MLIFVGTTGLGAGLPGGDGVILDHCHPRHLDLRRRAQSRAQDRRRATGLAVAGRDDRRAHAQAQHLVRAARLVAEVSHGRSQARHPAPAEGPHPVRRRLSAVHLRAAGPGLARRRLSAGGPRQGVPPAMPSAFCRGRVQGASDMDLELEGKVAIVGGASMGIGYGIARTLAAEGASVAITARRDPGLREARPSDPRARPAPRCCRSWPTAAAPRTARASSRPRSPGSAASTSSSTTTARRRSASS